MSSIRIFGWYYHPKKVKDPKDAKKMVEFPPKFDKLKLDPEEFKFSCREFEISDLEIIPMRRYIGNFLHNKELQAIIHLKGSLIPFFIERQKVDALRTLIANNTTTILRL
jgi:hypothetical protein